jgi:hypothetical protein
MNDIIATRQIYFQGVRARKSILCISVFLCFAFAKAHSQDSILKHQINLRHDNDFLLGIDRYYTTGSFIGYSNRLAKDFIFKHTAETPLQVDLLLGQETYTPRELFETDFNLLERPYAGYLFVQGGVTQVKKSHVWTVTGEFGLAGPQSLAGAIQRAYHDLINEFIPTWVGQIGNSIHANGYGSYVKSFQKEKGLFFDIQTEAALGTRQIFIKQAATLFIGRRDALSSSSFYNRIGNGREFYGYIEGSYRYVSLNALIQGHPFGDDSPFTLPIVNSIIEAKAGLVYRRGANTFQLEYVSQTNETQREGQLQYVGVAYKRAF